MYASSYPVLKCPEQDIARLPSLTRCYSCNALDAAILKLSLSIIPQAKKAITTSAARPKTHLSRLTLRFPLASGGRASLRCQMSLFVKAWSLAHTNV